MRSDRKVTREVKLTLLHLNQGLLVTIALGYSGVQSLLLVLILLGFGHSFAKCPGCLQL
jgi:hypothetical protein